MRACISKSGTATPRRHAQKALEMFSCKVCTPLAGGDVSELSETQLLVQMTTMELNETRVSGKDEKWREVSFQCLRHELKLSGVGGCWWKPFLNRSNYIALLHLGSS